MRLRIRPGPALAEAVCGVLAALSGVALLAVVLFADTMVTVSSRYSVIAGCAQAPCPQPTFSTPSRTSVTHSSIAAGGIGAVLEVVIAVVLLVLLAIAVGAIMHAQSHRGSWLALLCAGTALMLGVTLLTGFSIGLFFMPTDALAVTAVALGLTHPDPSVTAPTADRR